MTTRAEIVEMIEKYKAAEIAVLGGQSYSINGRSLSRTDLGKIREGRLEWERKLITYDNKGRRFSLASFY